MSVFTAEDFINGMCGNVVVSDSTWQNNAVVTFGDYKFALEENDKCLCISTKNGAEIRIDGNGDVKIESDTPLGEAARVFWKVVAACGPLHFNVHSNGLEIAQAKLYAIQKIHELLVEGSYEEAKHFASAALLGESENVEVE